MFRTLMVLFITSSLGMAAVQQQSGNTIRIISDIMECDQQKNLCIASGNAFAEQQPNINKRTLRAEKFIAHFAKSEKKDTKLSEGQTSGNELDKLEAHGSVVMTDDNNIILCDKAIYDHQTEIVELFENVKITNDQNQLNGTYGKADLKTKKYHVTNKGSQVEGLFVDTKHTKDKQKDKS